MSSRNSGADGSITIKRKHAIGHTLESESHELPGQLDGRGDGWSSGSCEGLKSNE